MVAQKVNPFAAAVLLFLGSCTAVIMVSAAKDWDPGHIRLYRSSSNRFRAMSMERMERAWRRERRYGSWVRAAVWPFWLVALIFGTPLGSALFGLWSITQAVARWVLKPTLDPVLKLLFAAVVIYLVWGAFRY